MSALDRIIANKRLELHAAKGSLDLSEIEARAFAASPCRDIASVLTMSRKPAIIAEIKKASPSAGALRIDADVAELAASYESAGAAALSVLTDAKFFGGGLQDLKTARMDAKIPILRKDFILTPFQLHEARISGADSALLIVAALSDAKLRTLYEEALNLGMTPLVEVHHERELERAMALAPRLVGVNNRDLGTLEIDLNTCVRLRKMIPENVAVVCESGVQSREDIRRLMGEGLEIFLIGSALMISDNPSEKLTELMDQGADLDTGEDMRPDIC
jgi:indole-3-glycerol phosphate synthase